MPTSLAGSGRGPCVPPPLPGAKPGSLPRTTQERTPRTQCVKDQVCDAGPGLLLLECSRVFLRALRGDVLGAGCALSLRLRAVPQLAPALVPAGITSAVSFCPHVLFPLTTRWNQASLTSVDTTLKKS